MKARRQFAPFVALSLASSVGYARASATGQELIPVYVGDAQMLPLYSVQTAQALASRMFATAGVRLNWLMGAPRTTSSEAPVVIQIHYRSAQDTAFQSRQVLAYTYPYTRGSASIIVFYDRVHQIGGGSPHRTGVVLAHVLVHEITHVLQRIDRHSPQGVMKPRWTSRDYSQMEINPLPFAAEDIDLIRLGMNSWARDTLETDRTSSRLQANADVAHDPRQPL